MTMHRNMQSAIVAHTLPERELEAKRKFYKTAALVDSVQSPDGTTLARGAYVGVAYQGDRIYAVYQGKARESKLVGYCHELLLEGFCL